MKLGRFLAAAMLVFSVSAISFAEEKKPAEKPKYTEGSCCDKAAKAGKECSHKCCVDATKAGKVCEKCNKAK